MSTGTTQSKFNRVSPMLFATNILVFLSMISIYSFKMSLLKTTSILPFKIASNMGLYFDWLGIDTNKTLVSNTTLMTSLFKSQMFFCPFIHCFLRPIVFCP